MQNIAERNTIKRTMHLFSFKVIKNKTSKVADVLANLGLDKTGTGKSNLSINHDNILYK